MIIEEEGANAAASIPVEENMDEIFGNIDIDEKVENDKYENEYENIKKDIAPSDKGSEGGCISSLSGGVSASIPEVLMSVDVDEPLIPEVAPGSLVGISGSSIDGLPVGVLESEGILGSTVGITVSEEITGSSVDELPGRVSELEEISESLVGRFPVLSSGSSGGVCGLREGSFGGLESSRLSGGLESSGAVDVSGSSGSSGGGEVSGFMGGSSGEMFGLLEGSSDLLGEGQGEGESSGGVGLSVDMDVSQASVTDEGTADGDMTFPVLSSGLSAEEGIQEGIQSDVTGLKKKKKIKPSIRKAANLSGLL